MKTNSVGVTHRIHGFLMMVTLLLTVFVTNFSGLVMGASQFNLEIIPHGFSPITNSPVSFYLPAGEKIQNMSIHRSLPGDVFATTVNYTPPIECLGQASCTIQTHTFECGVYTITVTTSNRNVYESQFTLYTTNPAVRIESPKWQAVYTKGEEMLVTWVTFSLTPQTDKWNAYLTNPNDFVRTEPVGGNPVAGTNCTFRLPNGQIDQVQNYWLSISSSQTNNAQGAQTAQVASATRFVTVDSNPTIRPTLTINTVQKNWVRLKIEDTLQEPGRTFWYQASRDGTNWSLQNEGISFSDGIYIRSDWYKNWFFRLVEVR